MYAEELLNQEKERKKEIAEELYSTTNDARDQLEFTLDTISDQINEIRNEIRQRSSTGKKVDKLIEEYATKKIQIIFQNQKDFGIRTTSKKNYA